MGVWQNRIHMAAYFAYILSSASRVLYTGVTRDLERRAWEHRPRLLPGFTHKYNTTRLVYYETYGAVRAAISREKEIKGWRRAKKTALIATLNPKWRDLSVELFSSVRSVSKPRT